MTLKDKALKLYESKQTQLEKEQSQLREIQNKQWAEKSLEIEDFVWTQLGDEIGQDISYAEFIKLHKDIRGNDNKYKVVIHFPETRGIYLIVEKSFGRKRLHDFGSGTYFQVVVKEPISTTRSIIFPFPYTSRDSFKSFWDALAAAYQEWDKENMWEQYLNSNEEFLDDSKVLE